jgi:hypothetical protein
MHLLSSAFPVPSPLLCRASLLSLLSHLLTLVISLLPLLRSLVATSRTAQPLLLVCFYPPLFPSAHT